jgi:hypothetical protein
MAEVLGLGRLHPSLPFLLYLLLSLDLGRLRLQEDEEA